MFRVRGYYNRFNSADPVMRFILLAGVILVVVILIPRFPGLGAGVDCEGMTIPEITGNNQSILATTVDPSALTLELVPEKNPILSGESLMLDVHFYNASMAPLTLFISPQDSVFRYTQQEPGLEFSIQQITAQGTQVLGEPLTSHPAVPVRQSYDPKELRVLGPRSRCNMRIEISPQRLKAANVVQGEYRITAVYVNNVRGALPTVQAPTPTPIFPDQGVWVGEVRSNEVAITISAPPAQ
jgi:hypothetical protein